MNTTSRRHGALFGMFIGDALAMPVHWYYDRSALRRDYGVVDAYLSPRNPHPDSILYRSSWRPVRPELDIRHEQARYWGTAGVHYHQFLAAGENTLNMKLARQLLLLLERDTSYDASRWLAVMIEFLTSAGTHKDTYLEEYLRHFFDNLGRGIEPERCGRSDEKHIGGFTQLLPLYCGLAHPDEKLLLNHLALTHGGQLMRTWGSLLVRILNEIMAGSSVSSALAETVPDDAPCSPKRLHGLSRFADEQVVGRHFSTACYVDDAVPAALYLASRYEDDPRQALIANTMCGGDNCGRGVVIGALLGARHGIEAWPASWRNGLLEPPPLLT
ncbi:MAG: ADP-ribosylglycohydrolase family protein [Desulfofustis sp. PB-SRB1]|jgi:ADP-ribosyl-[dinitrogen reductase] hydrolase|nr:ADP-ribosylglycohydrolase family protein [Desulfofustis sp. PB-SRB1]MBM1002058.1 ADP-ribosylglycohydrolase family protein [Desulfofustis sp. PB-SRB1]HBH30198.1 ADP-ribosylglycohydrolase family protein [Desulfofustis sp.]